MGKLLRVQIKVPNVSWSNVGYFRAEISGLYQTSIIDRLLSVNFGVLNNYKVNFPSTESLLEVNYDQKINPFVLMITLPSDVIKKLMKPENYFSPVDSNYFFVYEIVAMVNSEIAANNLQSRLDNFHLKKPSSNTQLIIYILVVIFGLLYLYRNKFKNNYISLINSVSSNAFLAYLDKVQSSTLIFWLYCLASALFTCISLIFPAKGVALSLATSFLMLYFLYRFINDTQTDHSLNVNRRRSSSHLYGFVVVVLLQLTTYIFVGRILSIDLNIQYILLPIFALLSCIGLAYFYTRTEVSFKSVNHYVLLTMIGVIILVSWAFISRISDNQLFLSIFFCGGVMLGSFLRLNFPVSVIFTSFSIAWIVATILFNVKLTILYEVLSNIIFGSLVSFAIPFKKHSAAKVRFD